MEVTEVSQYKDRTVSGYMLNAELSKENQLIITELNREIKNKFGDLIIEQPGSALHITLMDWVAPLVSYEQSHDRLFEQVFQGYDGILTNQTNSVEAFTVNFNSIRVSPSAIFIEGRDSGQFQRIRNSFLDSTNLPPGTKQPPKIVHCTIARFNGQRPLSEILEFVDTLSINFDQKIKEFRLIHEIEMPMLRYEVLKPYKLAQES